MMRRGLVIGAALTGAAVLVASLGGAASLLPATATQANPPAGPAPAGPPPSVVCNGTIDIEGGLLPLVPSLSVPALSVKVAEVYPAAAEGNTVPAGEPLLRLNHELADQSVAEAEAAVVEAKVKVREAEQALTVHAGLVGVQEAVIAAKKLEVKAAETGLERLKRATTSGLTQELQLREATEKVDALKGGVTAEEKKLEQLKAAKPTTKPDEANAAVARLEVKVKQAKAARDEYTLRAPSEGEIVRSQAEAGATFTSQTRQPAFWFRPKAAKLIVRAEVDQEFANRVKAKATAKAEDETDPTGKWNAEVTRTGTAFLPKRSGPFGESLLSEPTRTLEVILTLLDHEGNPPRVGQRVRVSIP